MSIFEDYAITVDILNQIPGNYRWVNLDIPFLSFKGKESKIIGRLTGKSSGDTGDRDYDYSYSLVRQAIELPITDYSDFEEEIGSFGGVTILNIPVEYASLRQQDIFLVEEDAKLDNTLTTEGEVKCNPLSDLRDWGNRKTRDEKA